MGFKSIVKIFIRIFYSSAKPEHVNINKESLKMKKGDLGFVQLLK